MKALSNHHSNQRDLGRALQKSAILGTVLALLLFIVNVQLVHAVSITVNTTDDELNADGDCSLREAIQAANTNAAVDACPAGEPIPTIDMISFGVNGTITLTGGQLTVSDDLTIDGPGAAQLTISGNNASRVMEISAGITLDLMDVTVANGRWVSAPMIAGAGILNFGTLTIANGIFSGNDAGGCCFGLPGGAVANSGGTVTVISSIFSGNSAGGEGGGIYSENGTLIVSNSTFSGNSTNNWGGGIFTSGGFLSVTNSTFEGNSDVFSGGGIGNIGGTVDVSNSTFTGNITTSSGGGGIWNYAGTLTVTNSTFSGNSATFASFSQGGGIQNYEGVAVITNSTFFGNSAGDGGAIWNAPWTSPSSLILRNTIVANSLSGGNCSGPSTDGGGNLSWPDSTCPGLNQDPLLDPAELQENGGPTKTIALQLGSLAIDSAVPANCPATDQRGVTRPQGAACDIGAYELEQAPADTTAPTIAITTPANGATYLRAQVALADYACADEAGGSGLASCVGTVPNGSAIDTTSVGTKTFTVDAADNVGNTNSASASYNVSYSFEGFFSPVDNSPTLNIAKAGQTIPLKWRITDAVGTPVTNLTSVTVTAVSFTCDQGTTTDQMEEYASGSSGLQNLGNGYYQFNWKPPKSYANSCKTIRLNLGEGLVHEVLFKFTK